jgi:hypothetical protein
MSPEHGLLFAYGVLFLGLAVSIVSAVCQIVEDVRELRAQKGPM